MADKKELIISANASKTDAELRKLVRTIKDLNTEGIKTAKVFGGFDMSKSFGSAMGVKNLLSLSKGMKELQVVSESAGRALSRGVSRDLASYEKALVSATTEMEAMTKEVEKWEKAQLRGVANAAEEVQKYDKKLREATASAQGFNQAITQLKGGGAPRFGGMTGFQAMSVAGGTAAAVGGAANTFQNLKTLEWQNLAGIRSPERNMLNQFMSGDFSSAYFMNKKGANGKSWANDALQQFGGQTSAKIGLASGAVGDIMSAGMGVAMLGGGGAGGAGGAAGANTSGGMAASQGVGQIGGGISGALTNFKGMSVGSPQATEAGTFGQGIEYMKAVNPMESAALQFIQQTAGMRVGAAKALQGRHMESWGMGSGYGLDMGQSFQRAQQMMGISGDADWALGTKSSKTIRDSASAADKRAKPWNSVIEGPFGNAEVAQQAAWRAGQSSKFETVGRGDFQFTRMTKDPIKEAEAKMYADELQNQMARRDIAGTVSPDRTVTTRSRNLFQMSSDMEQRGWSAEGAGQIFQRMGEGTGSLGKGEQELKEVMAYAIENGFKKSKMHEMIADAISQRKVGEGGEMRNFAEYAKMMYGGLGADTNLRDVRANIGGQRVLDTFTENQTFNLQKTAFAAQALGGRGTGGQMMALANTSYAGLAGKSEMLERYGISDDVRRSVFKQGINANLQSMGNMEDPALKFLSAAMKASGGDVFSALKGVKKGSGLEKDMGAFVAAHYKGATMDEGVGLARGLGSYGEAGPEGEAAEKAFQKLTKHVDGTAQATVATAQQQLMKAYKEETEIRDRYLDSLRRSLLTTDAIAGNTAGFDAFANFAVMLVDIMNMAQANGGKIDIEMVKGMRQGGQSIDPGKK